LKFYFFGNDFVQSLTVKPGICSKSDKFLDIKIVLLVMAMVAIFKSQH